MANDISHIRERVKTCSEGDLGRVLLDLVSGTHGRLDISIDYWQRAIGPYAADIEDKVVELANRGGRVRLLTSIDGENMQVCRETVAVMEVRHGELAPKSGGGFAVGDGRLVVVTLAPAASEVSGGGRSRMFYISETLDPARVSEKKRLFENLWKKAIPARYRFKEIEAGGVMHPPAVHRALEKTLDVLGVALKSATREYLEGYGIVLDGRTGYSLLQIKGAMCELFGYDGAEMFMEYMQKILLRNSRGSSRE